MKKDSKEANNFINKVRIKELNSQDDFTILGKAHELIRGIGRRAGNCS